jgi:LAO/AO transport system kinase
MLQLAHPVPRIFYHHGTLERVSVEANEGSTETTWIPPIQKTIATEGGGIGELVEEIRSHKRFLHDTGGWQQRESARLQAELDTALQETLVSRWRSRVPENEYLRVLDEVVTREISPWQAVDLLLDGGAA